MLKADPVALQQLRSMLPQMLEEGRQAGHDVDADPYLTLDQDGLIRRYLVAEEGDVEAAARRLRSTISWRRRWGCLEYHQPGSAERLFCEKNNPGAEMYFAYSGQTDKHGCPFLVGRAKLLNPSNMHPWHHLRAGVFVLEHMAMEIIRRNCGFGSYILDIGQVAEPGTVSGTGGGPPKKAASPNPHFSGGAGRDAPKELLDEFGELSAPMAVLRAAIRIGSNHYPEMLSRVVFLNSSFMFHTAFRVFSRWAHPRTRDKFHVNPPLTKLQEWYGLSALPTEWGGRGWQLGGDAFLAAAIARYDGEVACGADEVTKHASVVPRSTSLLVKEEVATRAPLSCFSWLSDCIGCRGGKRGAVSCVVRAALAAPDGDRMDEPEFYDALTSSSRQSSPNNFLVMLITIFVAMLACTVAAVPRSVIVAL